MQGPVDFAIAQNAHAMRGQLADHTGINQFLRTDFGPFLEPREIADVDRRKLLSERRIGEAAFWNATMQRHLAALEATLLAAARTGPHAFVSTCCRFSMSRTGATANAFCFVR